MWTKQAASFSSNSFGEKALSYTVFHQAAKNDMLGLRKDEKMLFSPSYVQGGTVLRQGRDSRGNPRCTKATP